MGLTGLGVLRVAFMVKVALPAGHPVATSDPNPAKPTLNHRQYPPEAGAFTGSPQLRHLSAGELDAAERVD